MKIFNGGLIAPADTTYATIMLLLNCNDQEEQDELTKQWRDHKLNELSFIGVVVCESRLGIVSYNVELQPEPTCRCLPCEHGLLARDQFEAMVYPGNLVLRDHLRAVLRSDCRSTITKAAPTVCASRWPSLYSALSSP
jgi:hypothetical protein